MLLLNILPYNMERAMKNILVIDDDRELCKLLEEYLKPEGFEVGAAHNGESGIEMALSRKYNLIVLDIMLPGGKSGFDVLQRLRALTGTPVIMLTARGDEVDRIVGLEMGADDYLSKPFNPRELLARIHAVLRRATYISQEPFADIDTKKIVNGDIELDMRARSVRRANKFIRLTSIEFQLLEVLMRNCGRVVSRDELANDVLDRALSPFDRSVDVHVSNLRKKIGNDEDGSERIKSVRGAGYVFVCSSSPDRADELNPVIVSGGRNSSNAET
jgi:two-component system, OmpR family, response regulator CpxR